MFRTAKPLAEAPANNTALAATIGGLGARVVGGATVFRAWTTVAERMSVVVTRSEGDHPLDLPMVPQGEGLHELVSRDIEPGARYRFKLNGVELPDPYARRLPLGIHGPAEVVKSEFRWTASDFKGLGRDNILYELHIGTFTKEGTYRAAMDKLRALASLGVTAIELMPLSSAAGRRGWGYDGVAHFAPFEPYGTPDELRQFVGACHSLGLGVILDVVYNHFGPAGNYLSSYSPDYFTSRFRNPWGDAPNYANPHMRQLVLDNALYWLTEFQMDGLRLDATHEIPDASPTHILTELARCVRRIERPSHVLLVAEDERNDPAAVTEHGLDALWADDFHHMVHVLQTGESDGYYRGYEPSVELVARTIGRGWLYEGQTWPLTGKPRGRRREPLTLRQLVYAVQNHDQIGNRPFGERLNHLVSTEQYRAASMLLLFLPATPLLFMGQEWAASSPFLFFTDHEAELGKAVTSGRRKEFAHFVQFQSADPSQIPDPQAEATFARSRLNWHEREVEPHAGVLRLYRLLLGLRRNDPVIREAPEHNLVAKAVGPLLSVERWLDEDRRWLFVNFGKEAVELPLGPSSVRALASSSDVPYRGRRLPPHSAIILSNG